MTHARLTYGSVALLAFVAACSFLEQETFERTQPHAFDVPSVSLDSARYELPTPDTVNLSLYVIDMNICPPEYKCAIPDGIYVAERRNTERPAETVHLWTFEPRQFRKAARYTITVSVYDVEIEGIDENGIRLLAYSRL